MHRARKPVLPRLLELREVGRREREKPGAVVGALERDDSVATRRELRRAQRDLDRVFAGDAELRGPRQRVTQLLRDLRVREIAERVHDLLALPCFEDARVAMAERG